MIFCSAQSWQSPNAFLKDDLYDNFENSNSKHLSTSINEITDWFKQYQVESIELWISGLIEKGGITKLVVSAKGEGGMRVMLKPKAMQQQ